MRGVSPLRAIHHYLTSDPSNLLLTIAGGRFLVERVIFPLGRSLDSFPSTSKIEDVVNHSFTFIQIGSVCKSSIKLSDILFPPNENMHKETLGVFPRKDNQYELRIVLNTLSLLLKIASSVIVINKALQSLGVISKGFSETTRLMGTQASILALCFDIHEAERVRQDRKKDIEDKASKNIPTPFDAKIKLEDQPLYITKMREKMVYDQTYNVCNLFRQIVQVTLLLDTTSALRSRAIFFISDPSFVSDALLATMAFLSLMRHVSCGATIRQLEKGDVQKKGDLK